MRSYVVARVHQNKSMQHHTLRSGTAEFQVTWPPKLRKGTYLVKNVRARFEYRKTSAGAGRAWKTGHNARKGTSLWRKTLHPKRVRFLAIDAPIVDYVCLPLYHLTFVPLCNFSAIFREEKKRRSAIKGWGFIDKLLTWVSGLPRSTTTPIHHFVQYAKVTLLEISPCQCPTVKRSGVAYSCSYALLVVVHACWRRYKDWKKHFNTDIYTGLLSIKIKMLGGVWRTGKVQILWLERAHGRCLFNAHWQTVPNKWCTVCKWEQTWPRGRTAWPKRISASTRLMRVFGKT